MREKNGGWKCRYAEKAKQQFTKLCIFPQQFLIWMQLNNK